MSDLYFDLQSYGFYAMQNGKVIPMRKWLVRKSKFAKDKSFTVKRCVVDFGQAPKIKRDRINSALIRQLKEIMRREAI